MSRFSSIGTPLGSTVNANIIPQRKLYLGYLFIAAVDVRVSVKSSPFDRDPAVILLRADLGLTPPGNYHLLTVSVYGAFFNIFYCYFFSFFFYFILLLFVIFSFLLFFPFYYFFLLLFFLFLIF